MRRTFRRQGVAVVALAALLVVAAGVAPASARAAQAAGPNTWVKITFVGGPVGVVKSTGAVKGVGAALEETVLNPDGTFTGTLQFLFPLGTVTATYQGFVTSVSVDATCTGRFTTVGTFQITAGTGLYAGIAGSGNLTESGIFNAVPTGTGCSPDLQVRTYLTTDATATVSLPSPRPLGGLLG
jgi:hypothetical protein